MGLIILVALGFALKTLPRTQPPNLEDLAERKAIKGLRPFSQDDAEIFARLQRERLLQTCVEVITSSDFRFGILVGESGCGKTSVLQAGILPQFLRPECEFCGVYVRFSDQEPLAAIRQALAEQLEIPMEWLTTKPDAHPFLVLLTQAVAAADKPVVLFLDQFEQWYVHAKQPEDRQPFLQGLMAWYKQPTPPVKILVSIRSDLFFHIVEIQKALHFDLGPQDVFQLAKFTPAEATQVLAVIAQTENLWFEESFVMELAEQELAGREDGLISPVDVQILAWMIERQNASELRAFNRQAFQKFGGVEGLLMRFLDKALMARVSEGQRQAALKVLLALTDLERQVRAGVLTVSELQQKLTGSLSSQEVREAVRWLERGDVRLITPINRQQQEVGYELAHERLIPSLLKQAGRELSAADQANQLLDRRVNEWLGNKRSGHYLFGPRELWSIKQQKPYLTWGPKRPQKEKLLALSWRRVQGFTGALMAVCLGISVFLGWLWYIPAGQMQQVRWALVNPMGGPLDRVSDEDAVSAAIAFAKDGKKQKAMDMVTQYVDLPGSQAQFFSQFTSVLIHETDHQSIKKDLNLMQVRAEKIDDPYSKSIALIAIAAAYGQINDPKLAQEGLKKILKAAEAANAERVMEAISVKYAYLNDWGQSLKALRYCPESWKVKAQIKLLTLWAEQKKPRLINGAVIVEQPEASEERGKYTFKANLYGPTEGCNQYVDWWEILSEDQELLDRPHFDISHDDQQPFSSTSKPIQASDNQTLLIRAHLHLEDKDKSGYEARQAWKGTIKDGFEMIRLPEKYATDLAKADPQPKPCQDKSLT
ncbi:ATP-binding protein [Acaryochloris sp. 'Moss Beach']|uniref:ATP-binding protein n=1 Tax=Acaryochloris sp. 'Moss Beach' TaxID=2740837 RepID=UPI001F294433|nr:ATP-binding protein [Acaryochloris sp. 'Moss Beach']UJB71243.1 ATP-binding protein [Acaryochloris sp. 'Moss Beach']